MRPPLLLMGLLVATISCVSNGGREVPPGPSIIRKTLEPGRRYAVSVPPDYSEEEGVPLVLALHYGGEVTPYFGEGALKGVFEPALRELGAIIVAPDCTGRGWTDPKSVEDVWAVLEEVSEEFNIDQDRTLVTGYSMGGMGSWHLAAHFPERFSAALVVSGRPTDGVLDGDWSVPLYIIHSRSDEVVPLEPTLDAVEELEGRGVLVKLVVLDWPTHYQTGEFVTPLRLAVPWVQEVWSR